MTLKYGDTTFQAIYLFDSVCLYEWLCFSRSIINSIWFVCSFFGVVYGNSREGGESSLVKGLWIQYYDEVMEKTTPRGFWLDDKIERLPSHW